MSAAGRLTILSILLAVALGGCAGLSGQGVYVGGDAGVHKEIH